jgi:pyrimidine and pyridine-specific 5'-nucleotidase
MNAKGAQAFGWTAVHFVEPGRTSPRTPAAAHQISDLEELRGIFPEFFKS